MTVRYDCTVDLSEYELTAADIESVKRALDEEGYDWYHDGDKLYISGEVEVDSYGTSAADIAAELKWLLWKVAEIDADVDVDGEPEECESNFDEQRRYFYSAR